MKHTLHKTILAASLAALPFFSSQAQALTALTDWDIDLSGLNPTTVGGTTYSSLGALNGLLDLDMSGSSTVVQNINPTTGSGAGLTFSEKGFLAIQGATFFDGSTASASQMVSFFGTNNVTSDNFIYFEWTNLTGVANAGGSITFDNGGILTLYLDDDSMTLAEVGAPDTTRLALATFHTVPISDGSSINIDGGAFPSGVIGITMDADALLPGVVIRNNLGNIINESALFQFIDTDATIATPAQFCTGSDGLGACSTGFTTGDQSFIQTPIQHNASTVPATAVPEPGMMSLLALSLVSFGVVAKRRNSINA